MSGIAPARSAQRSEEVIKSLSRGNFFGGILASIGPIFLLRTALDIVINQGLAHIADTENITLVGAGVIMTVAGAQSIKTTSAADNLNDFRRAVDKREKKYFRIGVVTALFVAVALEFGVHYMHKNIAEPAQPQVPAVVHE